MSPDVRKVASGNGFHYLLNTREATAFDEQTLVKFLNGPGDGATIRTVDELRKFAKNRGTGNPDQLRAFNWLLNRKQEERAEKDFAWVLRMLDDFEEDGGGADAGEVLDRDDYLIMARSAACACDEPGLLLKTLDNIWDFQEQQNPDLPKRGRFCELLHKNLTGTDEKGTAIVLFSVAPDSGKTTSIGWVERLFTSTRVLTTPTSFR